MTASSGDWITWEQAAQMVGCPVPTIDWHTRSGRIAHRPHRGSRPTLQRASVEAFAVWYAGRRTKLEQAKAQGMSAQPAGHSQGRDRQPPHPGWLSSRQVADRLGLSDSHVPWLIERDVLVGIKVAGRWWAEPQSVESERHERSRWLSVVEAAKLVDCSPSTISAAAQRGEFGHRSIARAFPSVERTSLLVWAAQRAERLAAQAAEDRARQAVEALRGRPDLQNEWLSAEEVAVLLGISRVRVGQLARRDRLPCVRVGRRWWFRRDHLELVRAARAAWREDGC